VTVEYHLKRARLTVADELHQVLVSENAQVACAENWSEHGLLSPGLDQVSRSATARPRQDHPKARPPAGRTSR
jgi:hypothetical protein